MWIGLRAANTMPFKCADKLPNLSHAAYQKAHLSLFFLGAAKGFENVQK